MGRAAAARTTAAAAGTTAAAARTTAAGRRQLRPRRVLSGETTVSTTYDLDTPAKVSDKVDVQLADVNVVSSESSFQPTSGSIEVSEPVTEINTELPTGEETTKPPADDTKAEVSTGAK